MEVHIANLRVLSQPLAELQKTLPSAADIPRCKMISVYYVNFTVLPYFDVIYLLLSSVALAMGKSFGFQINLLLICSGSEKINPIR